MTAPEPSKEERLNVKITNLQNESETAKVLCVASAWRVSTRACRRALETRIDLVVLPSPCYPAFHFHRPLAGRLRP